MNLIFVIILAVSLSMDAFSLAIAYGTLNLQKNKIFLISLVVGIYHFFMPLIGLLVGEIIIKHISISSDIIVFIVLLFIGMQMIVESFKNKNSIKKVEFIEIILFGFAVSIDSLSVGISMNAFEIKPFICTTIFSITSLIFTYIGLLFGKKLNSIFGKISTIIGGILLIILGIIYLI